MFLINSYFYVNLNSYFYVNLNSYFYSLISYKIESLFY